MTKLRRKLNRSIDRFCARWLSAKAQQQSIDKGNMNALRAELGWAPFHRGRA
jgi:hypothetical protein